MSKEKNERSLSRRRRVAQAISRRLSPRRMRDDRGTVAIMVSMMLVPVLLGSAAIGIDMANWYYQGQRLQVAADAAALAGSVYMPSDITTATTQARDVAKRNGFTHDPSNADPLKQVSVTPATANKASELRVSVTARVRNFFGWAIGNSTQSLTRTAVAEYRGPVLMGSPCNMFGNEPNGSVTDPVTTVSTASDANNVPITTRANFASASSNATDCSSTPQLWANAAGPGADKQNGDRYASRSCNASGTSGCTGTTNNDYSPAGHFYKLSVKAAVSSVSIQVFDPALVNIGNQCSSSSLPNPWTSSITSNQYTSTSDAAARYSRGDTSPYCSGDQMYSGSASSSTITTFAVRDPESSGNPLAAPVHTQPTSCTKQYGGWNPSGSSYFTDRLRNLDTVDKVNLAKNFRQWSQLCTITNPEIGDYYVQVRTNLASGATSAAQLTSTTDNTAITWNGHNRFALRAVVSGTASNVTLAGYGEMSIFANAPAADTQFHLSRVNAASAGMSMEIALFDAGDAAEAGTITIIPPPDATTDGAAMELSTCQGLGVVVGSANSPSSQVSCRLTNVSSTTDEQSGTPDGYQGKLQTLRVAIPADYSCSESDPFGCWFRIRFQYPSGTHDATTWSTDLVGQPVRLVE